LSLKRVEMFYEGILQLKTVFLAVELKANCFLEKSEPEISRVLFSQM